MPNFDFKTMVERSKSIAPTEREHSLSDKSLIPAQNIKRENEQSPQTASQQYHDAVSDYVTGKTDMQPDAKKFNLTPKTKTQEKSTTPFFDLKKKAEAKKAGNKQSSRTALYGTGVTKKLVSSQEKALERQSKEIENETLDEKTIEEKERAIADAHSESLQIAAKEIILDEYQQTALDTLKHERYGCLIGAAGTGKTTLEKRLIEELKATIKTDDNKTSLAMALVAFTGRAVQQIKTAVPVEYHGLCSTIHAFLGYMPEKEEYEDEETGEWKEKLVFRPTYTASNPLPHKLIFVDESGMVPIYLWNQLIEACPQARIILIGDINQLPPVQGKSVLGFAMCQWPTYELLKIHRQAEDNPIIANAHNILNGRVLKPVKGQFDIVDMPDGSLKSQAKFIDVIKYLHGKQIFDPFRDAIIVPKNVDNLGQVILNERLTAYFNPGAKRELIACGWQNKSFATGDKVMLLQNDNERQLTNGMTGVVVNIKLNDKFDGKRADHFGRNTPDDTVIDFDKLGENLAFGDNMRNDKEADSEDPAQRQSSHIMTVRFPLPDDAFTEVDFRTVGEFGKINHAYAFTCHKSQGGEYPVVIIMCHYSDYNMLTREWLYTAVTRAQQRVILCGNARGILQAIHTQKIRGNTVQEKAQKFLELQGEEKIEPILPSPEKM